VCVTPGVTFVQTVPVCEEDNVDTLGWGGVKFVYILYGLVNRIEPRGISIFPGVGRKCGKVQMSGKSSDRSKSCS